jgi:hypothetical protein
MNQGSAMLAVAVMGTGPSQGLHRFPGGPIPLSSCPGSSLPAAVRTWLAGRLATCCHHDRQGSVATHREPVEVRLDAVAAVLLDGLSDRRAAPMVGISKTEVGDSMDLLLAGSPRLGTASPTGRSLPPLRTCASALGDGPNRRGGRG